MQPSTTPNGIEVSNREQVLEISWSDGHKSVYPLFGLRKNCPWLKILAQQ
ncbi:MAG: gamma-butyrobetaine hydroxylase-like domain-containing protein [Balneola sp.]